VIDRPNEAITKSLRSTCRLGSWSYFDRSGLPKVEIQPLDDQAARDGAEAEVRGGTVAEFLDQSPREVVQPNVRRWTYPLSCAPQATTRRSPPLDAHRSAHPEALNRKHEEGLTPKASATYEAGSPRPWTKQWSWAWANGTLQRSSLSRGSKHMRTVRSRRPRRAHSWALSKGTASKLSTRSLWPWGCARGKRSAFDGAM